MKQTISKAEPSDKAGIYIHIPFCKSKCPYCAFYSVLPAVPAAKRENDITLAYVNALKRDIRSSALKGKADAANADDAADTADRVDTVYFGGGTPSLLSAGELCGLLEAVGQSFDIADGAEVTVEANPCSVREGEQYGYFRALRDGGFNRISFGVQSASDKELSALGRLHSFNEARTAVLAAYRAGFSDISCDLMLGIPFQTRQSLSQSIDRICGLPISHISAYMLTIEKGTRFDCDAIRSAAADEDTLSEMYLQTVDQLESRGFEQYEISSFSKNGARSRHNMKYWLLNDYYGFGASAHSFVNGRRYYYPDDIEEYIGSGRLEVEDASPDALEEYTMMSLRLSDGMDVARFSKLGGCAEKALIFAERLKSSGFCVCRKDSVNENDVRICLTPKGFLISNSIITEFLSL